MRRVSGLFAGLLVLHIFKLNDFQVSADSALDFVLDVLVGGLALEAPPQGPVSLSRVLGRSGTTRRECGVVCETLQVGHLGEAFAETLAVVRVLLAGPRKRNVVSCVFLLRAECLQPRVQLLSGRQQLSILRQRLLLGTVLLTSPALVLLGLVALVHLLGEVLQLLVEDVDARVQVVHHGLPIAVQLLDVINAHLALLKVSLLHVQLDISVSQAELYLEPVKDVLSAQVVLDVS